MFLLVVYLPHSLKSIGFFGELIRPKADDSREAQRITAVMPVGAHHVVKRHLDHHFRLNLNAHPVIRHRVFQEPLRHVADFSIGQA